MNIINKEIKLIKTLDFEIKRDFKNLFKLTEYQRPIFSLVKPNCFLFKNK